MFSFVIPTFIPWYFWNEKLLTAYMMAAMARYCVSLHITWLVRDFMTHVLTLFIHCAISDSNSMTQLLCQLKLFSRSYLSDTCLKGGVGMSQTNV